MVKYGLSSAIRIFINGIGDMGIGLGTCKHSNKVRAWTKIHEQKYMNKKPGSVAHESNYMNRITTPGTHESKYMKRIAWTELHESVISEVKYSNKM